MLRSRLAAARVRAGLTQAQSSERIGIGFATIGGWNAARLRTRPCAPWVLDDLIELDVEDDRGVDPWLRAFPARSPLSTWYPPLSTGPLIPGFTGGFDF